ncbi:MULTISPECIES: metalloregulator ArsR/SmtB family transcription factor [Desulfosporosinus]|uniref:Transcriptional regulator, ArsR family n=1 Tax=Desulfosporosinus metallidurans TaxID=1888891 RepID=A0A1Q8QTI2_9FIRM|nr:MULTISPECIES: metalloregulator ArsR/SmtB family transcription factor [Desulfosporosinus]OLN30636.1 Transcriptional regulator, ArsR family [Desulfosporosinus metallidurans]
MMPNKHNNDSENLICDIVCVHPDVVRTYSDQILSLDRATELADLFKTLGDPTRIRIMDALAKSEFCVCDLAELLDLSQSATSHQLRVLRNSNLVKYRRDGKMVYYSLQDNHVQELYRQGLEHIDE